MRNRVLPVLYVSHGSPMVAIEPGLAGEQMQKIGEYLQTLPIQGILMVSAHWLSQYGIGITASEQPKTIYDFYGFPDALYELKYPAQGSLEMAELIQKTLAESECNVELDRQQGLDHGVWIPLRYLFPQANIPVIQVSIPWPMTPNDAEKFGQALQPLRRQGVLIVTSGSQTHNLRDVAYGQPAHAYIEPFVSWMRNAMVRRDLEALKNYRTLAPNAIRAHPTEEHFMPMLIALAASENGNSVSLYDGGVAYSALSMDAYLFECTSETKG